MKLRQIETFRAVMLTGSISDAARLLHVSQPGISRTIRYLEMSLKVPLFERTKGRLVPTTEAQSLFREIERAYEGILSVQDFAKTLEHGADVRLRIVASPSAGIKLVPAAIALLRQRYPNVPVSLDLNVSQTLMQSLITQSADIGISLVALDHQSLDVKQIGAARLMVVLPEKHALVGRRWLSVKDIAPYPLISFADDTVQGKVINDMFIKAKIERHVAIQVRFAETACALVSAGAGIALVDELTAQSVHGLNMVSCPLRPAMSYPISVVKNKHAALSGPGNYFVEQVKLLLRSHTFT